MGYRKCVSIADKKGRKCLRCGLITCTFFGPGEHMVCAKCFFAGLVGIGFRGIVLQMCSFGLHEPTTYIQVKHG